MATGGLVTPGVPGAGAGRKQVALKPGHSLMHWVQLTNKKGRSLNGLNGARPGVITAEELAKHNTLDDCWMALQGRVYNVTPYMNFHPGGGEELLRGAGQDATAMFAEVHAWVNFDGFLEKCFVGRLAQEPKKQNVVRTKGPSSLSVPTHMFAMPAPKIKNPAPETIKPKPPSKKLPSRDWYQNDAEITLVVYKILETSSLDSVSFHVDDTTLHLSVGTNQGQYRLLMGLESGVGGMPRLQASTSRQPDTLVNLTITLTKTTRGTQWNNIGNVLMESYLPSQESSGFKTCKLLSISPITHDTNSYIFAPMYDGCTKENWKFGLAQHLMCRVTFPDRVVTRSYTVVSSSRTETSSKDPLIKSSQAFEVLVKIYPDGVMTQHFASLNVGDDLLCTQAIGLFPHQLPDFDELAFVACGTGITPMLTIIDELLTATKPPRATVLYYNKSEKDILLETKFAEIESDTFKTTHVLSQASDSWEGLRGRIHIDTLKSVLPPPHPKMIVFVCGRAAFSNLAVKALKSLGYQHHVFS
eukprot:m.192218 g.192218  ORF g.192218 m.192218 type:complete len:528 (+) comp32456_c0_seq1:380-1963(+)